MPYISFRTPVSLGIESYGGLVVKIIPKNTFIPVKKSILCYFNTDEQSTFSIHILLGDRKLAKYNVSLGVLNFEVEPPKRIPLASKKGIAEIEIFFEVEANGILSVTAKDRITNKESSMTISGALALSEEESERMIRDADSNAAADQKRLKELKRWWKLD